MQLIREPLLSQSSPLLKILSLLLIILLSLLFTLIFGMALGFAIYGSDVLDVMKNGFELSDPALLPLLKYMQIINTLGLFVFPPLIFALLVSKKPWAYLSIPRSPDLITTMLGLTLIIVILPFLHWVAGVNEMMELPSWMSGIENWMKASEDQAREITELFLLTTSIPGLALNLIMIAILPAIGEEFLFRGVLQRLFNEWTKNIHLAVFIAALLFSALHLQFYGFFPRLILGIMLGYLFVWTRSIWVPVLVHFFNNAIAVVAAWLYSAGYINSNADSLGDMPQPFIVVGSMVVTFLLLMMIRYYEDKKKGSTIE